MSFEAEEDADGTIGGVEHRTSPSIGAYSIRIGSVIGCSEWLKIDQARIDAFAEATLDEQFVHVDPIRAAATHFGGTIAHGFLTLSLLSAMSFEAVSSAEGAALEVTTGSTISAF